jgi:hypothetical protein
MLKLGTEVKDRASGLKGMLTHMVVAGDGSTTYLFQPKGLTENGGPVDKFFLDESRIEGGVEVEEPYLYRDILGTQVEDMASGYKGTAIELTLHVNGCVHIGVQAAGKAKNGGRVLAYDFDVKQLKGKAIKPLSEAELVKEKKERPSPIEMPSREYVPGRFR